MGERLMTLVRINNKFQTPTPFPKGCKAYLQFFKIEENNYPYWLYQNAEGEDLFIVYRQDYEKDGQRKKRVLQGSHISHSRYIKKNLWTNLQYSETGEEFKLPLFRLPELIKTDKPVLVPEGEKATEKAQELFPDYFVTCFSGGKGNFNNSDWSVLKGRNVSLWADTDHDGKGLDAFTKLSLFLKYDYGIDAKLVPIPTYDEILSYTKDEFDKKAWDLADEIPKELDIRKLLESAALPEITEESNKEYLDIKKYKSKFVFLADTGNRYWDRSKRRIRKETTINNLFLRSKKLGHYTGQACSYLQENNCDYVESTSFYPIDKEIFEQNGTRYLNLYRKPKFESLKGEELNYNINWFREHVKLLSSNEPDVERILLDTIASAVQKPEINRTWALLIYSGQGVGKGAYFKVIESLVGVQNSSWLKLSQLTGQFQSFMLYSNNLFVREANSKGSDNPQLQATLKELISDDTFQIEMKGVDLQDHRCHYNLYMSTNEANPIKIDNDDRRICFVRVENSGKNILHNDPKYFDNLFSNVENPQRIRELHDYFNNVHVVSENFNHNIAPNTKWKIDLIEASKTFYEELLDHLLEEKLLPCFQYDLVNKETIMKQLNQSRLDDQRLSSDPRTQQFISPRQIQNWINSIPLVFKYKDYAIEPPGQARGHYWVIRNCEKWRINRENTELMKQHFRDEVKKQKIENEQKQYAIPF